MKNEEYINLLKKRIFLVIFLFILFIIRFLLSCALGNNFESGEFFDDALLVNYANLESHFNVQNTWSLVKTMGYPLFLCFVKATPFNYTTIMNLLWGVAAFTSFWSVSKISKNKIIALFSYSYVLFLPMGFEWWLGTRMYRNSIIGPFVIILFSLLLVLLFEFISDENSKIKFIYQFIISIVFVFTYYIKEDGIWILACLLFFCFLELLISIKSFLKKRAGLKQLIVNLLIIILPIALFESGTFFYKQINYKYFGVKEIQTRTEGELGKFVSLVYKVKSDNRSYNVWAPTDALEKVVVVSPTLQSYPEFVNDMFHSDWYDHDIYAHPIQGDFLTWVLRYSADKCGVWKNEKQMSDLFSKINSEIETAFKEGKLEKDNKIQILSSAGGKSIFEILNNNKLIIESYKGAIFLKDYRVGGQMGNTNNEEVAQSASEITGLNYLTDYNLKNVHLMNVANQMVNIIFNFYRCINVVLCCILFFSIVLFILRTLINYHALKRFFTKHIYEIIVMFVICIFLGFSFAYSFSIVWFADFLFVNELNNYILNFYTVALPPLLYFVYVFSIIYMNIFIKEKRSQKNESISNRS